MGFSDARVKSPEFDAYELLCATHSHNSTQYSHIVGLSSHFYALCISKLSILSLLCQIQLLHRSCCSIFIQENTGTADLSVLCIILL